MNAIRTVYERNKVGQSAERANLTANLRSSQTFSNVLVQEKNQERNKVVRQERYCVTVPLMQYIQRSFCVPVAAQ